MPAFNAEAEIKNVDRRLDKLEATVGQLEKSVKLLIDTRGDSKADALKKLEMLVREQAKDIDAVPKAQTQALADAIAANTKKFEALLEAERTAARVEFSKADVALKEERMRREDALKREQEELGRRIDTLHRQAEEAQTKRVGELDKQQKDLADRISAQGKAQAEALRDAVLLEQRLARIEAMVMAALGRK